MARNYSDDEVEAIFRRALERQVEEGDGYGHDELIAAAREVGLDDDAIDKAVTEIEDERGEAAIYERLKKKQREAWQRHFVTYLVVAGGFLGMHALGFFGVWTIMMAFGWGMGMALHTFSAFRGPTEEDVAKERKKLNRKARRTAAAIARRDAKRRKAEAKAAKRARQGRNREAGDEIERAIEEGVTLLLSAAANKLREAAARSLEPPAPRPPETEFERYVADQKGGATTGSEKKKKKGVVVTPPPARREGPRARVEVDEDEAEEIGREDRRGRRRGRR